MAGSEKAGAAHGGARNRAGRKQRLTTLEAKWLKDRYEDLMRERAKERTLQRALPETRIGGDLAELRDLQSELRGMPLGKRKSEDARQIQEIAAEIIDGKRIVRVGSGRGPSLPGEPSAAEIRAQVAAEANALWGRRDVTPRMVRSACAVKLTDEELMARWLSEADKRKPT